MSNEPSELQGLGEGNQPLLDRKIGVWRRGHGVGSRSTRKIRILQKKRRKERARDCDKRRTSPFWCLLKGEGSKDGDGMTMLAEVKGKGQDRQDRTGRRSCGLWCGQKKQAKAADVECNRCTQVAVTEPIPASSGNCPEAPGLGSRFQWPLPAGSSKGDAN